MYTVYKMYLFNLYRDICKYRQGPTVCRAWYNRTQWSAISDSVQHEVCGLKTLPTWIRENFKNVAAKLRPRLCDCGWKVSGTI